MRLHLVGLQGTRHEVNGGGECVYVGNQCGKQWHLSGNGGVHIKRLKLAFLLGNLFFFFPTLLAARQNKVTVLLKHNVFSAFLVFS